jgi:hypothetical protein
MRLPGPCCFAPSRRLTNGDTSPIGDASTTRPRRAPPVPRMLPKDVAETSRHARCRARAGRAAGGPLPAQARAHALAWSLNLPWGPPRAWVQGSERRLRDGAAPQRVAGSGRAHSVVAPWRSGGRGPRCPGRRPFSCRRPRCAAQRIARCGIAGHCRRGGLGLQHASQVDPAVAIRPRPALAATSPSLRP